MKILITGGNGQLAKALLQSNKKHELVITTKKDLNVEIKPEVFKAIKLHKPDMVFHLASMTRGDECAANPKKAYKINVTATRYVADVTAKLNIPMLFVSTNEVFDGKSKSPYTERSRPRPGSVVGKEKYLAEQIVRKINKKHFIVRTMWLYNEWSENFIHAVIKKAQTNASIKLVYDEIGTPTNSLDLAKAIFKLIATKKYGTYHLANKGSASRLEFGKEILDKLNYTTKVHSVSLEEFKRLSKPPLYSVLDTSKAEKIGITMRDWRKALREFISTKLYEKAAH